MQPYSKQIENKKEKIVVQLARTTLYEIGLILKAAREKKRLTLKDVREETCIPIHHILAIESGAREKLPEDLFLIGFIKRYARTLGLNEHALCEKYCNSTKSTKSKDPNKEQDAFNSLFSENRENKVAHFKVYHFYFLVVILLFVISFYFMIQLSSINVSSLPKEESIEDSTQDTLQELKDQVKSPAFKSQVQKSRIKASKPIVQRATEVKKADTKKEKNNIQRQNKQGTIRVIDVEQNLKENESVKLPEETMLRPLKN